MAIVGAHCTVGQHHETETDSHGERSSPIPDYREVTDHRGDQTVIMWVFHRSRIVASYPSPSLFITSKGYESNQGDYPQNDIEIGTVQTYNRYKDVIVQ